MGCENNFLAVCQGVKKGFSKKKCALFVFVFFMLEQVKGTIWKKWKRKNSKKAQKNSVFWVAVKKMFFLFVKMSFFRKIGKHYLCSDGKKKRTCSLQLSVLGKWYFFGGLSKSPNTTKIGVSADTGENPKWHFWLQKCHFGFSLEKGFYYLWYLKAVFRWKHYFCSVFSKTQLCRHERMYFDKKQKFYKNRGWFARMQKGVFFHHFFGFGGLFFFSLCFCGFVLFQIAQNGYFPAFLEVFCLFCSHRRPVLKCFFSSYFVFFFFCLPFQKSIFIFSFCPSTPFNKTLFVGFLLFFFCLSFLFLSFACLFDTNFPNIPFFEIQFAFVFGCFFFFFFCCCCFCFHCVCFSLSVFLLLCWLCFWCFCFVLFCVFVLLSCFAFSLWKRLFSLQFWCLFELCWLKG